MKSLTSASWLDAASDLDHSADTGIFDITTESILQILSINSYEIFLKGKLSCNKPSLVVIQITIRMPEFFTTAGKVQFNEFCRISWSSWSPSASTLRVKKKQYVLLSHITYSKWFSKFFTVGLGNDCVTNWWLNITLHKTHPKCINTLPCETLKS